MVVRRSEGSVFQDFGPATATPLFTPGPGDLQQMLTSRADSSAGLVKPQGFTYVGGCKAINCFENK